MSSPAGEHSRVLSALAETLRGLVAEGFPLSAEVSNSVRLAAESALHQEVRRSGVVPEISGRLRCYRACRGEWMLTLDGAELEWNDESGRTRSKCASLRILGAEASGR
mmetsp:Transcript_93224/g.216663  ORF Transcript_93224/g.216663 Transcript_93224/m.216663 type:complete len:108 (+) Transcript_93224:57-380(+)